MRPGESRNRLNLMWNTSDGHRILKGAEAALFKAGVLALVECVKEEDEFTGDGYVIAVFDALTWSQRLAVLECVATHLLTGGTDPPKLSAVNESAIAMVYEHISHQIDDEIDRATYVWRTLVLNAAHDCFWQPEDETDTNETHEFEYIPNSPESTRIDLWHPLVQSLADQILWDRDFEMMETFVDEPPEKATMMRQIMGIDEDYFATAAEDLNSKEDVEASLNRLTLLLAGSAAES